MNQYQIKKCRAWVVRDSYAFAQELEDRISAAKHYRRLKRISQRKRNGTWAPRPSLSNADGTRVVTLREVQTHSLGGQFEKKELVFAAPEVRSIDPSTLTEDQIRELERSHGWSIKR